MDGMEAPFHLERELGGEQDVGSTLDRSWVASRRARLVLKVFTMSWKAA